MTTALDSNILVAFWNEDDTLNREAERLLEAAAIEGDLILSPPVYLEIRALRDRDEARIDYFLQKTGIRIDWRIEEAIWREAAKASYAYAKRRGLHVPQPRRVAADFLIGAHALIRGYTLLTLDKRTFRVAYPALKIRGT